MLIMLSFLDQKSGKAAGKERNMDDYQNKMGDVDKLTVKLRTLEVGNNIKTPNIRQDIIRNFFDSSDDNEEIKEMELWGSSSMKTNAGEDPEDWIDAFVRPETKSMLVSRPTVPVLEIYTEAAQQHKVNKNMNLFGAESQDKSRDDLGKGPDFIYIPGGDEDHPEEGMKLCSRPDENKFRKTKGFEGYLMELHRELKERTEHLRRENPEHFT